MQGHDDRWLYPAGPQALRGGDQAPAPAPQRSLTLDSLYPPSMASSLLLNTNFPPDAASDALRGQALPSPHREHGAPAEPQSPTQMLLGLLGLLPNSTGPSPRLRQPSSEGQNLNSMLDLLAQDGQQPGSLHSLLAHHGNATTGLTPREEISNQIFDCAPLSPLRLPRPVFKCDCVTDLPSAVQSSAAPAARSASPTACATPPSTSPPSAASLAAACTATSSRAHSWTSLRPPRPATRTPAAAAAARPAPPSTGARASSATFSNS